MSWYNKGAKFDNIEIKQEGQIGNALKGGANAMFGLGNIKQGIDDRDKKKQEAFDLKKEYEKEKKAIVKAYSAINQIDAKKLNNDPDAIYALAMNENNFHKKNPKITKLGTFIGENGMNVVSYTDGEKDESGELIVKRQELGLAKTGGYLNTKDGVFDKASGTFIEPKGGGSDYGFNADGSQYFDPKKIKSKSGRKSAKALGFDLDKELDDHFIN